MNLCFLRTSLVSLVFFVFGGFSVNLYAGWFDSNDSISVAESKKVNPHASAEKYAATIRISGYADARIGEIDDKGKRVEYAGATTLPRCFRVSSQIRV